MTNPKRVLVVDDDASFRQAIQACLDQKGYETVGAENGRSAQQVLQFQDFDAIVSDIRMPEVHGIELLHWVKKTKPTPFILMTGFSELLQTQEAFELGASGFIAKPFKREELYEVLKQSIVDKKEEETPQKPKDSDEEYCKICIDDFISGSEIQYEIYIRLTQDKYVKIAHSGMDITMERIKAYKEKNIRFLFLKKDDFNKYVGFNLTLSKAAKNSHKISREKKLNLLKHTGEIILTQLHLDNVDEEAFENAKTMVETTTAVLSEDRNAFDLLQLLKSHGDFLYAHSVGVSMYASMIGRALGWTSPRTLFKLSVGGLLHDIGEEIPREVLDKPRRNLTAEEIKLMESHPVRGSEILSTLSSMPVDILQIVHQHHENCVGLGYPSRLKKSHIHPMARLVSIASEFCNLVLKNPNSEGMAPKVAIERLITLSSELLDHEMLIALAKVFNLHINPQMFQKHKKSGRAA